MLDAHDINHRVAKIRTIIFPVGNLGNDTSNVAVLGVNYDTSAVDDDYFQRFVCFGLEFYTRFYTVDKRAITFQIAKNKRTRFCTEDVYDILQ